MVNITAKYTIFLLTVFFCISGFNVISAGAQTDSICVSGICFPLCSEASIVGSNVSGEEPAGPKEYALDGNLSTYWVDFGRSYLELDIGDPQVLCNVELAWPYGESRMWYFDISSANGSKVTTLSSVVSGGNTSGFEKYDITDTISDNIRIGINGNSETDYSGIAEVKIYTRPIDPLDIAR